MNLLSHIFGHYIFKGTGVAFLFFLGRFAYFFNPARTVYSFKEIWNKQYDKGDRYWQFAEEFSQKLIGVAVLGTIMIFIFL